MKQNKCPNNCFDGMVKHYPIPESALFDFVKCPHCKGTGFSNKPIE